MQTRNRRTVAVAGVAVLAALATACAGSSSTPQPQGSSSAPTKFTKLSTGNVNAGTPVSGGTLNVSSSSDTDYLDPNITYYSLGYALVRLWSRQLYSYAATPAVATRTNVVPDLATAMPDVSADGLTYKITIRDGVYWNTTPKTQVTAADVVRGLKATCNPVQPMGGLPDFNFIIKGFKTFCAGYAGMTTPTQIANYAKKTDLPGVEVDPNNPQTVVFTLTQPTSFFVNQLAMPAFSPRPAALDAYIPGSTQIAQHTVSDGPYQVESYQPTKEIVFTRNPVWDASTDPLRKAYVDKIDITLNNTNPEVTLKELKTDSPGADLSLNGVPAADVLGLVNDPRLNVESEIATNPYVLYNTVSPNNNKALQNVQVRQALSYAINRSHLIQVAGGPKVSPPLTHVLPPEIEGGSPDFDPYPYNPTKAQQLLNAAGVKNLTLKFLYRPSSPTATKMLQVLQQDLGKVGVKVTPFGVPDADFYTKYLQRPASAQSGQWDLSLAGWLPDWYGNAALSFFGPLFDGRILPPASSDFGLYNSKATNKLIDEAETAKTEADSTRLWQQADHQVMADAAFYPISDPNAGDFHAAQVHNTIWMAAFQTFDMTNVWLDKDKQGG